MERGDGGIAGENARLPFAVVHPLLPELARPGDPRWPKSNPVSPLAGENTRATFDNWARGPVVKHSRVFGCLPVTKHSQQKPPGEAFF